MTKSTLANAPQQSNPAGTRRAARLPCCAATGQELASFIAPCLLLVRGLDPWPLAARLRPSEAGTWPPATPTTEEQRDGHKRSSQVAPLRPHGPGARLVHRPASAAGSRARFLAGK